MGTHKAVQLLLKLAKIIAKKTKTTKDDVVIDTLIEVWEELQQAIPVTYMKARKQGIK